MYKTRRPSFCASVASANATCVIAPLTSTLPCRTHLKRTLLTLSAVSHTKGVVMRDDFAASFSDTVHDEANRFFQEMPAELLNRCALLKVTESDTMGARFALLASQLCSFYADSGLEQMRMALLGSFPIEDAYRKNQTYDLPALQTVFATASQAILAIYVRVRGSGLSLSVRQAFHHSTRWRTMTSAPAETRPRPLLDAIVDYAYVVDREICAVCGSTPADRAQGGDVAPDLEPDAAGQASAMDRDIEMLFSQQAMLTDASTLDFDSAAEAVVRSACKSLTEIVRQLTFSADGASQFRGEIAYLLRSLGSLLADDAKQSVSDSLRVSLEARSLQ